MRKRDNAYLTVYLTLFLTAALTLCLLLIEGVRKSGAALEASCAADVSMQSIMAEYHRELLEQYNIFAVDSSYGTNSCGKGNTEAHLYHYLERNLRSGKRDFFSLCADGAELIGVSILTDENGAVFRRCAVEAIRDDVGLELLEQLQEWVKTVQINGLEESNLEQEKAYLDREIEEYEGEEEYTEKVDNPTERLNELRRKGILKLVAEDEQVLSYKALETADLIGSRMAQGRVSCGNISDLDEEETLLDRFFFQEYLLRYLGRYGSEKEEGALEYQTEYLLAGKESDIDNLRIVAGRLCAVREAANAAYLFSDAAKSGEAEILAATICTVLLAPELTPVLHASILLGWAYAESLHDVKMLLAGGRIPLLKDDASWQLGLSAAMAGEIAGEEKGEKGLSYEDYLRIFMILTDLDTLTGRAMDIVEADIRGTSGNAAFRLDGCYTAVQAKIHMVSDYGYGFELVRTKHY